MILTVELPTGYLNLLTTEIVISSEDHSIMQNDFYSAMLCISAVPARGVCLSVCHVRELRQNE